MYGAAPAFSHKYGTEQHTARSKTHEKRRPLLIAASSFYCVQYITDLERESRVYHVAGLLQIALRFLRGR